jgi:hypothetical protein
MDISIEGSQGLKNMSVESLLFQIGNGGVQVRADGVCESPHRIAKKKKSFLSHGKLFYFFGNAVWRGEYSS